MEKAILLRLSESPALVCETHPRWTEKKTGFNQEYTVLGGNRLAARENEIKFEKEE